MDISSHELTHGYDPDRQEYAPTAYTLSHCLNKKTNIQFYIHAQQCASLLTKVHPHRLDCVYVASATQCFSFLS